MFHRICYYFVMIVFWLCIYLFSFSFASFFFQNFVWNALKKLSYFFKNLFIIFSLFLFLFYIFFLLFLLNWLSFHFLSLSSFPFLNLFFWNIFLPFLLIFFLFFSLNPYFFLFQILCLQLLFYRLLLLFLLLFTIFFFIIFLLIYIHLLVLFLLPFRWILCAPHACIAPKTPTIATHFLFWCKCCNIN